MRIKMLLDRFPRSRWRWSWGLPGSDTRSGQENQKRDPLPRQEHYVLSCSDTF